MFTACQHDSQLVIFIGPLKGYRGRIRARPDLPDGAPRLQPRVALAPLRSSWAQNLAGRFGWHGVRTTTAQAQPLFVHLLHFVKTHMRGAFQGAPR